MSADPTYGFDLEGERAKYRAAAREVVDGNGFEAIVYEVRGELERDIWVGQRQRPEEHEALEVAGRYVDALVDKALRTHVLKRERQDALPGRLNANMARLDELAEERKDISSEIKRLESRNRTLIREAQYPHVDFSFSESIGSYTLTEIEEGKEVEDDRQQELDLDADDDAGDDAEVEAGDAASDEDAAPDADSETAPDSAPAETVVVEGDATGDADPTATDGSPTREAVLRAILKSATKPKAARALGLSLFQLRVRLEELGLDWKVEREKAKQGKRPGLNPADVVWPKKQAKKRGGKKAGTKAADKPAKRVRHDEEPR